MSEGLLLGEALKSAEGGIPVFPLHAPIGTACTCGSVPCGQVGKHPRTAHGFKEATCDLAQIEAWWRRWPSANIGGRMGTVAGLVALDVDPRNGGDATLAALESAYGELPTTLRAKTGGGGAHIFFRCPAEGQASRKGFAPGLDLKADEGYVVLAPSLHASGGRYEWECNTEPADMPPWLLELVASRSTPIDRGHEVSQWTPAYAEAALRSEVAIVASATGGNRHAPLFNAALKLGRFVPALLARDRVERCLFEAARESGHLAKDGERAVMSAIRDGLKVSSGTAVLPHPSASTTPPPTAKKSRSALVRRFSDIEPQEVEWLWPGYLPYGAISMLDGDPGLGKSTLALDLAARLSRGDRMPDESGGGAPASSIVLTTEDDLSRVVRPRLEAAGADLNLCATVTLTEGDAERELTVCRGDLESLAELVRSFGARLLILDPLIAMLPPDVNAHNDQHVRQALRPLRDFAETHGVAVICLRHLRKSGADQAVHRGGGSIGIIGAARAGLLVGKDPSDSTGIRKIFAVQKLNLGPIPQSLAFDLATAEGGTVARIRWAGVSSVTADELVSVGNSAEHRTALAEAEEWVRSALAGGPRKQAEIEAEGRAAGHSPKTLRRAMKSIGAKAEHVGAPGASGQHWQRSLPAEDAQGAPKMANSTLGHLGKSWPPSQPAGPTLRDSGLSSEVQASLSKDWESPTQGGAV